MAGALTPGPNNMLLMSQGLRFGFRACLPYIFGVQLGFGLLLLAMALGLGLIINAAPWLLPVISICGAIWLAWLAWGFAKAAFAPDVTDDNKVETYKRERPIGLWEATAFQWINPKGLIFAIGVTGSYTALADSIVLRTSVIIVIFLFFGFVGNSAWAAAGGALNALLSTGRFKKGLNLFLALVIFATAGLVAYYGVTMDAAKTI